ncbi:MAG TPA: DNA alkylation repair protein [Candidatus Aenigmarchaeota archaeon]|nr:DNA alkylation repair protein [Candidatus Aenigmarchaeota archaeon]
MSLIQEIRKDLKEKSNPDIAKQSRKFFKEKIKTHGLRSAAVMVIAKKYFPRVKLMSKQDLFILCEELLMSGYNEQASIAFYFLFKLKNNHEKIDFNTFEKWLKKYVDNWGKCDDFCTHALGHFVMSFPEYIPELNKWAKSSNRWMRRASAVTLIYSVRRKKNLEYTIKIANILLRDGDDMVQKGYGWMLKEASKNYPEEVLNYVIKNKHVMPRTALRYAIEKLPLRMKKEAMKR